MNKNYKNKLYILGYKMKKEGFLLLMMVMAIWARPSSRVLRLPQINSSLLPDMVYHHKIE
jgi:hypothetical protein